MDVEPRGLEAIQMLLEQMVKLLRSLRSEIALARDNSESTQREIAKLQANAGYVTASINVLLEEVKLARQQRERHQTVVLKSEKDPDLKTAMEVFRDSKGFVTVIKWLVGIVLGLFALIEGYRRVGGP